MEKKRGRKKIEQPMKERWRSDLLATNKYRNFYRDRNGNLCYSSDLNDLVVAQILDCLAFRKRVTYEEIAHITQYKIQYLKRILPILRDDYDLVWNPKERYLNAGKPPLLWSLTMKGKDIYDELLPNCDIKNVDVPQKKEIKIVEDMKKESMKIIRNIAKYVPTTKPLKDDINMMSGKPHCRFYDGQWRIFIRNIEGFHMLKTIKVKTETDKNKVLVYLSDRTKLLISLDESNQNCIQAINVRTKNNFELKSYTTVWTARNMIVRKFTELPPKIRIR